MAHYKDLKSKWSSGGISSSEEIYLDAAQGSILSSSMATAARTGADEVSALAKKSQSRITRNLVQNRLYELHSISSL